MNSSNVQDMASAATLFILLGLLLVPCRAWCRGIARKVAVGSFRSRAVLTRRIMRAMSWRVGLVVVGLFAFGLLGAGAEGPRSFATQSFIPATIWSYPLVLLSLWQIARRISKRIFETTSPEQRTDIPPQMSEAAARAGRYRPTVIEGIVGAWFVLMLFSFAIVMLPNHRKASPSVPTNATEASAPLSQQADRHLSPEPTPVGLTAAGEASRTIRGHDIQYTLTFPANWTTKTGVDDFDTLSSYKSSYVGVIAEEAQVGTPEVIASLARERIKNKATDLYWSQPRQVELDGRTWMEFTVKCQMENIPVGYEFCVYSGREGTFQILGFTTQNLFNRDAQLLRTVMQTFRFPRANGAAQLNSQLQLASQTGPTSPSDSEASSSRVVLSSGGGAASHAGTASEVFEKVSPSVVLITTQDEKGYPLALGSGFVVAKDTVASNFHVVRGAAAAKVKLLSKNKTYRVNGILASNAERDVALLEVAGLEGKPLNLRSRAPIAVGATVYAIGNPKGLEGTISSGIVSARRPVEGGTVLQISAPISPGSSGGPVVDELSTVVGVATATIKGGEALNFAVPAEWVDELLRARGKSTPLSEIGQTTQQAVLGSLGEPAIKAVDLKYTNYPSYRGIAGISSTGTRSKEAGSGTTIKCYLANHSDRTISQVALRVTFISPEGAPMDFEDAIFSLPIPPNTTRGTEFHYSFSIPALFHLPGEMTYRDLSHLEGCKRVTCTVIDFQYSDD